MGTATDFPMASLPDRIITAIDRDDDDHAREAGRICRDMGDGSCVSAAKFREFLEGLPQDKAEELARALEGGTGTDLPDRIIKAIDLNEDGSLTQDELVAFMKNASEIMGQTDRDDDDHAREAGRICKDMGDGSCVSAAKFR